jgi:hypothetical protein
VVRWIRLMMMWFLKDDTESQATSEKKDGTRKKKQLLKTVELPIEVHTHGYSQAELNNYIELEVSTSIIMRFSW